MGRLRGDFCAFPTIRSRGTPGWDSVHLLSISESIKVITEERAEDSRQLPQISLFQEVGEATVSSEAKFPSVKRQLGNGRCKVCLER